VSAVDAGDAHARIDETANQITVGGGLGGQGHHDPRRPVRRCRAEQCGGVSVQELLAPADVDDGTGSGQLVANTYRVDGPYVRPFLQGVVGSRFGIAEIAGGVRFAYTWAQQSFTPFDPGTPQLQRYDATAVHLDPFVVARLAVDILRIEAMAGLALTFGDASVGPFFNAFASLGLGVVFDTWEPATPDYGADPILVPGQPIPAQP
jgi:hypothetical protein